MDIPTPLVRVEGVTLKKTVYPVMVRSQGTVQPRTQSALLPEVSGRVVEVSPSFRPGGFFEKDQLLLKIDPVDYETALVTAKAQQAQAESVLAEEQAKADQARENWQALGRSGQPSALALREPQLAKAKADVESAKAQVLKAKRDLERTEIRAPYAGQVLEQGVDVGQYVSTGTTLGKVFATDYVEVRLPLPERESRHLVLPEHFRGEDAAKTEETGARVKLKALLGGRSGEWDGRLVRVEGAIDATTRQIVAVAQVDDPFSRRADGMPPMKIGQFVEAEISGDPLNDVFILPRSAVRAGNEIILITADNRLRRLIVEPLAGDEKHLVVSANSSKGPKEGDVLCVTPIPFPAEGAKVLPTIDGQTERPGVAAGTKEGAAGARTKGPPAKAGRES